MLPFLSLSLLWSLWIHSKTSENMVLTPFWWSSGSLPDVCAFSSWFLYFLNCHQWFIYSPTVLAPSAPPAPGNETRPAKVRVMRSSCLEVQCHSWIGFASKAYFARRANIHGCTVGAWGHPRTLVQAPLPFEQCSSAAAVTLAYGNTQLWWFRST